MQVARPFYLALGWAALALGAVGLFLPILPTTPFVILAVWAFGKSSPALAKRLREHPNFGLMIRGWQDKGAIPLYGKIAACTAMLVSGIYLVGFSVAPMWVAALICAIMAAVAAYVVSRPTP